jgi:hypothetical protein
MAESLEETASFLADEILQYLGDLRGVGDELYRVDSDIMDEIRQSVAMKIAGVLRDLHGA